MKNITIRFGLQSLTRGFSDEASVRQITQDNTVRGYLGFGDNVRAIVNGTPVDSTYQPRDGMSLTIETLANSKAAPDQILVRFGVASAQKYSDGPLTVRQIKNDGNLRAALGYGDQIRITMNGVALPDEAYIPAGSTVQVETLANTKAN